MRTRIAVIGGGIAGLTAAYLLHEKYDVTLFERDGRLGGNAYTLAAPDGGQLDIAAAVFGRSSGRNLFRLFRKLGVATVRAFGPHACGVCGPGVGYYDLDARKGLFFSPSLRGMIAQRGEVLKPRHVMSVLRLMRGLRQAQALARQGAFEGRTLAEALTMVPSLRDEARLMLVSSLCLLSSMSCEDVLDAPAVFFLNKLKAYNDLIPPLPKTLFSVSFVKEGTVRYVRALSAPYADRIVLNAKIASVGRRNGAVQALMEDGRELVFDKIVLACNADQALGLLRDPSDDEQRLLGAWKYTEGRVVVHSDHRLFPKRELMEGYTFLYRPAGRYIETSVSGTPWVLPNVSKKSDLISTQHPNFPIAKDRIVFEKIFRTPRFDFPSCATMRELPTLNGVRNTYYCGSHFGFGLHEDAVTSAIAVARLLQVEF